MGVNTGIKQLQLYFFDNELEGISQIIYLAGADTTEGRAIVASGPSLFSRLSLIMRDESSDNKTDYFEKLFAKMNQANVLFKLRLTWSISKGHYKLMLMKIDGK